MTKTELESKHLAELHSLAAAAGIPRYRMLARQELIDQLAGEGGGESKSSESRPRGESRRQSDRRPRERRPREGSGERAERGGKSERSERPRRERAERAPKADRAPRGERQERAEDSRPERAPRSESTAEPASTPEPTPAAGSEAAAERPKRRRRRRFGRRGRKGIRVHDLLVPATAGRQVIVYGDDRNGCTELLRGLAAEIAEADKGPDPIALLIDPSPEEIADWRREAPAAEIVAAGQARHADDAIAHAARRSKDGEDVIVLVDSLSRFVEAFGDSDEAKALFDSGRSLAGSGTLTVVAAIEKQQA